MLQASLCEYFIHRVSYTTRSHYAKYTFYKSIKYLRGHAHKYTGFSSDSCFVAIAVIFAKVIIRRGECGDSKGKKRTRQGVEPRGQ